MPAFRPPLLPRRRVPFLSVLIGALAAAALPARGQGIVETWGSNYYGELGTDSAAQYSAIPAVVNTPFGITSVAGGTGHSLALRGGAVYAWGDNSFGQFGDGSTNSSTVPVTVPTLADGVTAIAAGQEHSLAIRNGAAYGWGYSPSGEIGNGSTDRSFVPVPVTGLSSGVTAVAAGNYHSLAIQNGAAYAWGYNGDGRLGDNSTAVQRTTPVLVYGLSSGVTAIAGGGHHSMAIRDGAVYTWGSNSNGELGNGSTTGSNVPVPTLILTHGVTAISAGIEHCLAIQNGEVYAWGGNYYGELGNNTNTDGNTPALVDPTNLHDIVAVLAGWGSSYALSSDGSLWVWGRNDIGQLGLGDYALHFTPQHLLPPAGYRYAALDEESAGNHVVAILTPVTPAFFNGQIALSDGVDYLQFASGNPFGYYAFLNDPRYLYHFDLGYEYVFDAADGKAGVYLYDFKSGGFFYTSPTFGFPYLYDFGLNTVLYYYPDPNHPGRYNTNGVRYFYRFDTGQIITK